MYTFILPLDGTARRSTQPHCVCVYGMVHKQKQVTSKARIIYMLYQGATTSTTFSANRKTNTQAHSCSPFGRWCARFTPKPPALNSPSRQRLCIDYIESAHFYKHHLRRTPQLRIIWRVVMRYLLNSETETQSAHNTAQHRAHFC